MRNSLILCIFASCTMHSCAYSLPENLQRNITTILHNAQQLKASCSKKDPTSNPLLTGIALGLGSSIFTPLTSATMLWATSTSTTDPIINMTLMIAQDPSDRLRYYLPTAIIIGTAPTLYYQLCAPKETPSFNTYERCVVVTAALTTWYCIYKIANEL